MRHTKEEYLRAASELDEETEGGQFMYDTFLKYGFDPAVRGLPDKLFNEAVGAVKPLGLPLDDYAYLAIQLGCEKAGLC